MNFQPPQAPQRRPELSSAQVLEAMYLDLRPRFLSLAYSILRNREDAEDAVQDAFSSAYRNLPSFEGRSALTTWLTRIVMNASLMLVRKRKTSRLVACPEDADEQATPWIERIPSSNPDPEALAAQSETLQLVESLLHNASPALTDAFKLKLYEDVSAEEGARHFGVSSGTFKSRVFRARRHLRARGRYALIAPIRKHGTPFAPRSGARASLNLGRAAA
jgi:RNA polymerase sigma-70 factor (ECF subfamily)